MVFHANKNPAREHVRRYNRPQSLEISAIIPGAEDGIVGRQDLVARR